ncbi:MAG: hypothetical protein AAF437_16460 [Pseudomonadota bacterium]
MTDVKISTERVLELIAAFGAEPGAWPEAERAPAVAWIAESPNLFSAALAEARALDNALSLEHIPEPGPALGDAILAAAPSGAPVSKSLFAGVSAMIFPQGVRWPAGAAFASLMMGLVGGYAYAATGPGYDQAELAYYAAFGGEIGEDWMVSE